jgi:hypothetical protein
MNQVFHSRVSQRTRLIDRIQVVLDYENSRTRISPKNDLKFESFEKSSEGSFSNGKTRISTKPVALPSSVLFRR